MIKKIGTYALFIIIGIGLVIVWDKCSNKKTITKPDVTSVPEQVVRIVHDSTISKGYKDSVNNVIAFWQRKSSQSDKDWNILANNYNKMSNGLTNLLNQQVQIGRAHV